MPAWRTMQTPFLGILTKPTLVVEDVGNPDWPGYKAGLSPFDVIVTLDDQPLTRTTALMHKLRQYQPGDVVTLTAQTQDSAMRDFSVRLINFSPKELSKYFILPYVMGLLYLGIGFWVFLMQKQNSAGQVFAMLCAMVALSSGLLYDTWTTHLFPRLWITAISLSGSVLAHLALVFPQRVRFSNRFPILRYLVYVPGVALTIANQFTILNFNAPLAHITVWRMTFVFIGGSILATLAMMIYRYRYSESPVVKAQAITILWGNLLGFGPIAIWAFINSYGGAAFSPSLILPWMILFPLSIAYAILRYRLLNINTVFSQGVVYVLLSAIIVSSYFFLLYLINQVLGLKLQASNPISLGIFILLWTLLLAQVWSKIETAVDRVLLGEKTVDRREIVRKFADRLTEMVEMSTLLDALQGTLQKGWQPKSAALYLHDPQRACYAPHGIIGEDLPSITFASEGRLTHKMLEQREIVYLYHDRPLPPDLVPEHDALEELRPCLFIPVPDHGWLTLVTQHSDVNFTPDDLGMLESLGSHVALALDKVRMVSDLKRRVAEMDVLRWVGQAVNFAMDVDDLMELIYTQTSRVLNTSNFYVALYNPEKDTLSFAFYIEEGERRYPEEEWSANMGLTGKIIHTGQPIVTEEYIEECRRQGVSPGGRPGQAWMGVPLKAGDQIIGVMNVSSFDPAVVYTEEQLEVFSAIADQAAAILDKARLYREMEERTQQLAAINEVSNIITSTLDLQTVLNLIMEKAVELIQAEAGSLILVNQDTDELVFRVATGPSSADLAGTRLPSGTGIAGRVVEGGESIIVRDAQSDKRWFRDLDAEFVTHSIIAVPMVSREKVIGVIELLNRRDGAPFDEDDENLLTAFASNAAIAVENARLFTRTDQALAARVEELSMMQRIDRELNATLDYEHVMNLTLDWALRTTGADIGLLAVVVETEEGERGLRFLANRGYPEDIISNQQDELWPLDRGIIGRTVQTGEASLLESLEENTDYHASAPDIVAQLTVPIRREDEVIGVVALESSEKGKLNQDELEFIIRLVDHAAVAIENARLFEQVRRANQAKTDFISFVSHELKQPMTSIKGYTDLLLKGQGGELNEAQRSFLNTVQANVDRMRTMVSDLLDVSRIESGRIRLDIGVVSLTRVVEDVLRTTRGQIKSKKQTLEVDIEPDLPFAQGDQDRLVQVLTNLVSNAYKYTPEDGNITVSVHRCSNGAGSDQADQFIRCSVSDTGIGISPKDQQQLFTKYFRANDPSVRSVPGTGLGLVIAKSLVELQGGEIWIESEVGEGSTFSFTVPVALQAQ